MMQIMAARLAPLHEGFFYLSLALVQYYQRCTSYPFPFSDRLSQLRELRAADCVERCV